MQFEYKARAFEGYEDAQCVGVYVDDELFADIDRRADGEFAIFSCYEIPGMQRSYEKLHQAKALFEKFFERHTFKKCDKCTSPAVFTVGIESYGESEEFELCRRDYHLTVRAAKNDDFFVSFEHHGLQIIESPMPIINDETEYRGDDIMNNDIMNNDIAHDEMVTKSINNIEWVRRTAYTHELHLNGEMIARVQKADINRWEIQYKSFGSFLVWGSFPTCGQAQRECIKSFEEMGVIF